jgi:hypothetical protein
MVQVDISSCELDIKHGDQDFEFLNASLKDLALPHVTSSKGYLP